MNKKAEILILVGFGLAGASLIVLLIWAAGVLLLQPTGSRGRIAQVVTATPTTAPVTNTPPPLGAPPALPATWTYTPEPPTLPPGAATSTLPPTNTPQPPTSTIPPSPTYTASPFLSPTPLTTGYVVAEGDTLSAIAARHNTTIDAIIAFNDLGSRRTIVPGQLLVIPLPTPTATVLAYNPNVVPAPAPLDLPASINDIPLEEMIFFSPATQENVRAIFARGQALGRDARAFSKLGDSTIENPHFLARYDSGPYNLGAYTYLSPMLEYYAGSWSRQGIAVQRGLNSAAAFDSLWARDPVCNADEGPLACEIRVHNPSVLFIRLGSNDRGISAFEENLRAIIEYTIDQGVIPLLGTKADHHEGGNDLNDTMRKLAVEYDLPLWDWDRLANTLRGRGLADDGIHLTTFFTHDYTQSYATYTGYGAHNLLAMITLDLVWRETVEAEAVVLGSVTAQ